jgi:hypothetical protein
MQKGNLGLFGNCYPIGRLMMVNNRCILEI